MDEHMLEYATKNGFRGWNEMHQRLSGDELHQHYRQCFQQYLSRLDRPNDNRQLPSNLIIYRQAKKLDYAEFCKWINSKLRNCNE